MSNWWSLWYECFYPLGKWGPAYIVCEGVCTHVHSSSLLKLCMLFHLVMNVVTHWLAGLSTISPMMQSHGKPTSCLTLSVLAFRMILRITEVNISFLNEDISLSLWDVICTSLSTQPNISYFIFSNLFINEMLLHPQGLPFNTGSYAASLCPRPRGLTRWQLHPHLYSSSKTPLSASILYFASWQFPEPAVDYCSAHSFWFLGLVLVALIFRAISCDIISVLLSIWSSWPLALLLLLIVLLYSLVLKSLTPAMDLCTLSHLPPTPHISCHCP